MNPSEELARLKRINPKAEMWNVGGPLVFLPRQTVRHAGQDTTVDALLAPRAHSGYSTRLFFDRPFPGRGQNWSVHQIGGRAWHAMSFNNVPDSLPWTSILATHLGQLQ